MPNLVADHPLTRREALDRLRGLRRSLRKFRDKLNMPRPQTNQERHEMYEHACDLVAYADRVIRVFDTARPDTKRRQ